MVELSEENEEFEDELALEPFENEELDAEFKFWLRSSFTVSFSLSFKLCDSEVSLKVASSLAKVHFYYSDQREDLMHYLEKL